jgi:hypothetical protein
VRVIKRARIDREQAVRWDQRVRFAWKRRPGQGPLAEIATDHQPRRHRDGASGLAASLETMLSRSARPASKETPSRLPRSGIVLTRLSCAKPNVLRA